MSGTPNIHSAETCARSVDKENDASRQGKLLAVIIPMEYQDYNSKNKENLKCKVDAKRFLEMTRDLHVLDDSDSDEKIAARSYYFHKQINANIDSSKVIASFDFNIINIDSQSHDLYAHLNREADETADKLLNRLEVSVTKKMAQLGKPIGRKATKTINRNTMNTHSSTYKIVQSDSGLTFDVEKFTVHEMIDLFSKEKSNVQYRLKLLLPSFLHTGLDVTVPTECDLEIVSNPPTILSVQTFESFSCKLFSTVPVTINTETIYSSRVVVSWFVDGQLIMHDKNYFIPEISHEGKSLSVLITPYFKDIAGPVSEAYTFQNIIEPLPSMPTLSPLRDDFIGVHRDNKTIQSYIRVVTYNILADLYVTNSRGSQEPFTMYPHVKPDDLKRTRRMPMILAELLAYRADIICLQEVDLTIFDTLLRPVMYAMGYDGFYSNKASSQPEGCAMFWSNAVFDDIDCLSFALKDLFFEFDSTKISIQNYDTENQIHRWDCMQGIQKTLIENKDLKLVATEKTAQILQIAKLKLKATFDHIPSYIIIGNTHLFYHPLADHIRAMQVYVVCKKIDDVRRSTVNDHSVAPFILCGDLNSDPLSGATQLLFSRSIDPTHRECWKNLHKYKWEHGNDAYLLKHQYIGNEVNCKDLVLEEEKFVDVHKCQNRESYNYCVPIITLPDSFPALISGCSTLPEFTNYAVDFVETLDYVIASEPSSTELFGFSSLRNAPFPSICDMKKIIAMPNEFMPSDHVSVVCDLEWVVHDSTRYN